MAYVIMALDECGTETRLRSPFNKEYPNETEASKQLIEAREHYPEYRSFWVEELMDKRYWARISQREQFDMYEGENFTDYV